MAHTFDEMMKQMKDAVDAFLAHFAAQPNVEHVDASALATRSQSGEFASILNGVLPESMRQADTAAVAAASLSSPSTPPATTTPQSTQDQHMQRTSLELALRRALHEAVRKHSKVAMQQPRGGFEQEKNEVTLLIDAALWCKKEGHVDSIFPLMLLEDLLSVSTLELAELVFQHLLTPRIDLFLRASEGARPRLWFLRCCNSLLRRLSKTSSSLFAGQINKTIAWICGVDERSAQNIMGKINTANVTIYDKEEEEKEEEKTMKTDEEEEQDTTTKAEEGQVKKEDEMTDSEESKEKSSTASSSEDSTAPRARRRRSLYSQLWSLQSFFLDPSIVSRAESLEEFQTAVNTTLDAFEKNRLSEKDSLAAIIASNQPTGNGSGNGNGSSGTGQFAPSLFPKWLTGKRLLDLQMRDPVFRRNICMQILIYVAHVLNPQGHAAILKDMIAGVQLTGVNGDKVGTGGKDNTAASASTSTSVATVAQVLSGTTLPLSHLQPLRTLFFRTLKLLRHTPPHSHVFTDSFLSLLLREHRFWITWKNARCPQIERPVFDRKLLEKKIDLATMAKEEKERREAIAAGKPAPAPKETAKPDTTSAATAAARKRKFGTMSGVDMRRMGMDLGMGLGLEPPPTKSARGRLFMGTEALAKLWAPIDQPNIDLTTFLSNEERAHLLDLQNKFITVLIDEETEWREQEAWKKEQTKKKEAKKKAAKNQAKAVEEGGVKTETKEVYMDEEEEEEEEYPGFGINAEEMLRNDAHKCWQFLRLLSCTPEVEPTWLPPREEEEGEGEGEGEGGSKTTSAPPTPSPVSGLDLFMRSEGSVQKLVDWWLAEKKKKSQRRQEETTAATIATSSSSSSSVLASTSPPVAPSQASEEPLPMADAVQVKQEDQTMTDVQSSPVAAPSPDATEASPSPSPTSVAAAVPSPEAPSISIPSPTTPPSSAAPAASPGTDAAPPSSPPSPSPNPIPTPTSTDDDSQRPRKKLRREPLTPSTQPSTAAATPTTPAAAAAASTTPPAPDEQTKPDKQNDENEEIAKEGEKAPMDTSTQ